MSIDLEAVESRINDGIYGDDRMTDTARDDAFSALAVLLAEVERLRGEVAAERAAERAAVVAWLRREVDNDDNAEGPLACILAYASNAIERGEHRREERE